MVPSDLIPSFARNRHARYRTSHSKFPDAQPASSPITGFSGHRINADRRAAYSFRTGLSARNGLSLARDDLRSRRFRHGVKVPGLLLRFRAQSAPPPGPSWRSATKFAGLPRFWLLPRARPVAVSPLDSPSCASSSRSPSGLLPPSGSTLPLASPLGNPPSRTCPISGCSPKPVLLLGLASDHRFQSATAP